MSYNHTYISFVFMLLVWVLWFTFTESREACFVFLSVNLFLDCFPNTETFISTVTACLSKDVTYTP